MFNRFLGYDQNQRLIRVESGVTVGALLEFAVANDLMPPVLPGYPTITVGGALAMNVHGKNQYRAGNFGEHVKRLSIYHPRHGILNCSSEENADLFNLTLGGFGLTGFILSADIQLEPLRGKSVRVERHKVNNLIDAVKLMESMANSADGLYSWHDLNQSDKLFGRGMVYLENFSAGETFKAKSQMFDSTYYCMPWSLLNKVTAPILCKAYGALERIASANENISLYQAYFPIVGKEFYFRLFGRRGFREYQVLFPRKNWSEVVELISVKIKASGVPITLASLKLFQGKRKMLNFVGDGICFAIDTPNNVKSIALFNQLDEIAIKFGGIGNIAKDSRLSARTVALMYDGYSDFSKGLRTHDPTGTTWYHTHPR
jgi:decaprenylphospho-beta-D-ribofuranose 2-oxidase